MSYVYFWLREDKTPYYIGYGSHKTRAYAKHPRKGGSYVPRPDTSLIHIWEISSKEKGKLREWEMINFLKPMLCNIEPGYTTSPIFYGENNPFFGKVHTEQSKKKIGESNRGRKDNEETKIKKSLSHRGEKNINFGKPREELVKKKISDSLKGRKSYVRSEETKRKISESAKARWAKYRSENRQEGDL